ncbi:MAG: S23 ribosomal protein [Parcubacteria group bacterium GW2011_GWF2_38_76]|nr:MAG: S23 ribosomal protein [Parcubacteria group bacterium GW2011_GWF2_38_76]HBM45795.1 four helix bundle protein [Patescibacteria group bacterium]
MATIHRFEDLICWKKARELTKEIYKAFKDSKDRGLKDQIERAAVSVMSNIAEGFERGTKQEFLNYLFIAKGSAGEVRSQLYIALDVGYLNIETFKYLNSLATENSRLIQSFTEKVRGGSRAGTQFKKLDKKDPLEEIIKEKSPELYEKFYGKN